MSNFVPACPKCGNKHTWLESDRQAQRPVLRCQCGLFEYTSAPSIEMARIAHEAAKRAAEEARRRELISLVEAADDCAWGPCGNEKRERSIYCSRDCSNKNARARFAARKAG